MQLAYVIPLYGAAQRVARQMAEAIGREFGANQALVIEPHITLKQPFEAAEALPFEGILDDLARELGPIEIHITGMNWFEPEVIFLDLHQDERLKSARQWLLGRLAAHSVQPGPIEDDRFHFHITVGWGLPPATIRQVWERLRETKVEFRQTVEEVHLVANTGDGWFIARRAGISRIDG